MSMCITHSRLPAQDDGEVSALCGVGLGLGIRGLGVCVDGGGLGGVEGETKLPFAYLNSYINPVQNPEQLNWNKLRV